MGPGAFPNWTLICNTYDKQHKSEENSVHSWTRRGGLQKSVYFFKLILCLFRLQNYLISNMITPPLDILGSGTSYSGRDDDDAPVKRPLPYYPATNTVHAIQIK